MILTTAAFLSALGFGIWILGWLFGYPEIAVIGGIVVFGLGFMITTQGLQYESGEIETELGDGEVETESVYSDVELPTSLSLGTLVMLVGGVGLIRSLDSLRGG